VKRENRFCQPSRTSPAGNMAWERVTHATYFMYADESPRLFFFIRFLACDAAMISFFLFPFLFRVHVCLLFLRKEKFYSSFLSSSPFICYDFEGSIIRGGLVLSSLFTVSVINFLLFFFLNV